MQAIRHGRFVEEVGRHPWLGPALLATTGLLAYHGLWIGPNDLDVEGALFRPGELPALSVLLIAGWLLWRRRERLLAVCASPAPSLALALAALGGLLFAWALLTRKVDLLLPSLAANGLAFAVAIRGRAGGRVVLLPALVLLLGIPLPKPLEDEIVWRLQLGTAKWAGWLLDALGRDFLQSGVILRDTDYTFHVIDACCGLNGIAILTGIALIVRELFAEAGPRSWLLVAFAPLLGFPLNVARVAYVAASPNPEALAGLEGDHTTQGLVVVMAGTALLYTLGWAMAGGRGGPAEIVPKPGSGERVDPRAWLVGAAGLAGLALMSFALPPFAESQQIANPERIALPAERAGWTSEPAPHDPFFTGIFPSAVHRRYQRDRGARGDPEFVDLLIGYVDPARPDSTRLLSSKLLVPGPDWNLLRRGRERLWMLERDAELALSSREPGGEHALVYAWQPRDEGLWRESGRALLGLDASPFRRARPRAAVRVIAYAPHDGQLALDRARQRLDRWIALFRDELDGL